jgi:hypothetical protein
MGQIIKPIAELPYKSLIFNYRNLDQVNILFDDTNRNWQILSGGTGFIGILDTGGIQLEQDKYCVIVTPIRQSNNHSICVVKDFSINNVITLVCCENGNNTLTDDGFDNMTVQINFFNL